jgi:hypothetical protein
MDPFATSHFSDDALLHNLKLLVAHDCRTIAVMLTRIAEAEERRLFLQAGYSSMHGYCVHELHFSEGVAYKRIEAARTARRFPGVLTALAEGRVHLRAVLMLAPYLTSGNADELLAAATHKTRFELQQVLAERFPRPDVPERLRVITSLPTLTPAATPAPGAAPIGSGSNSVTIPEQSDLGGVEASAPGPARPLAPERVAAPAPRGRVTPLTPERFAFQCTFDREAYDLFQEVRALMSHEVPTGEMALVLKGALTIARGQLLKRKCAATDRPGRSQGCTSPRHIPAAVKRAVWARDGGRCAFVSESGRRCEERAKLEYDHAEPVARGGQATPENVHLLCRSHNQFAADRAFGVEFMERRRAEAFRTW